MLLLREPIHGGERIERALNAIDFAPMTPHSVADREGLLKKLDQTREQGYAVTDQEYEAGVCAAAAPIFGAEGGVIAAINISGPAHRVTKESIRRTLLPALLRTSGELSLAMGFRSPRNGTSTPRVSRRRAAS